MGVRDEVPTPYPYSQRSYQSSAVALIHSSPPPRRGLQGNGGRVRGGAELAQSTHPPTTYSCLLRPTTPALDLRNSIGAMACQRSARAENTSHSLWMANSEPPPEANANKSASLSLLLFIGIEKKPVTSRYNF